MAEPTELSGGNRLGPRGRAGTKDIASVLDRAARAFSGKVSSALAHPALDEVVLTLADYKRKLDEREWKKLVAACREHRLFRILQEDPFTQRTFEKPRGYAGDACMMDMIYGVEDQRPAPPATPIGRIVFDYMINGPACQGVRSRRAIVAACIDRLATERARPHVLSIAAGHLREANLSVAIRRKRLGRMVALDADAESMTEVQTSYGELGVETRVDTFRALLGERFEEEAFDLVYSTGLFDYVAPRTGRRLVRAMHRRLRPGGSLLVANFLPGVRDTGYMEAFMDWKLVYRSRSELVDLTHDIPEAEIKSVELWAEEALNVLFLRVTRH